MSYKILIVGGGLAGMSCAISLAKSGHAVHLVDQDRDWRAYGAGITIQAPTFRALRKLGLLGPVMESSFPGRGTRVRLADGTCINEVVEDDPEPGLPASGGILRPVLHVLLAEEVRRQGVNVRLGLTAQKFEEVAGGVQVAFTDGSADRFDLMVGADGIYSATRQALFPQAPRPRFTGQGAFRVIAPRPPDLDMIEVYLGNPIKAGVTPISQDHLYMFTLTPEPRDEHLSGARGIARLREALQGFGGLVGAIRDQMGEHSQLVYRPLESIFLQRPWHRGRIMLIGDAVHATPPQLASGAGSAFEDGILLAEYLSVTPAIEEAFRAFTERRFDRCRHVVESSVRLGEMELAGASPQEQGAVYAQALARLAEPA